MFATTGQGSDRVTWTSDGQDIIYATDFSGIAAGDLTIIAADGAGGPASFTNTSGRGGPYASFWLSMIHYQLGNKTEARQWYDNAVQRLETGPPKTNLKEMIDAARREAEQLLGITQTPNPPAGQPDSETMGDAERSLQESRTAGGQKPEP